MSRLLDEALPLDAAARRLWLERLSPEHLDLAQHMREALLPEDSRAACSKSPLTPSKFASALEASRATATSLQAGARVGPYELIRPVGSGGMAEVWLARRGDGAFKREVALKLPRLTHLRVYLEQRFARERDILASLEHPHIARFYDAGIDTHGLPYVAMEYVRGQPLTSWFEAHCLEIPARLELFLQVLAAVQYAHENHVIHRDLKPSNILVTESGQVRLLDFGIAKLLEAEEEQLTQLTNVYGRALTPDYASPELLRGDPADARSDIYSLGVLLYETLTGVRPYQLMSAASMGMLEQAIAGVDISKPSTRREQEEIAGRGNTPEKWIRHLRGDLDAIALKALANAPAARYASVAALAEDLRSYLDGKPIKALPARFTDRLGKFARRNRTVVGVTAAAVAAVLAVIGYTLHWKTAAAGKIAANAIEVSAPRRTSSLATVNRMAPVASTAAESSIAVLPFVDMSEKKDQEYFSDGLSEELIELLARTPRLRVSARTSSFYFKGRAEKLETIAAELRVANVLEGSVRKAGNRLRVTAQLIRVDTGEHTWSQTYDRDIHDIFSVQDEIASAVVTALKAHLLPPVQDELRTRNIEAYSQYLRGRESNNRGDTDGYQRAVTAFSAATALDPTYAAAYADLALAEYWLADAKFSINSAGYRAGCNTALEAAEKAVALAPGLARGYSSRGFVRGVCRFDLAGEQADHDKALALSPNDADVLHRSACLLATFGNLPGAIAREEKALELDPLSADVAMRLAFFLAANQQFLQARPLYEKALAISPNSPRTLSHLADLELLENRPAQALALFRQPALEGFGLGGRARAEYSLGHFEAARRALEQLTAQDDTYGVLRLYAWRGEKDQAFKWAERAYAERNPALFWIKIDPFLRSLRDDARYKILLRKLNLPD